MVVVIGMGLGVFLGWGEQGVARAKRVDDANPVAGAMGTGVLKGVPGSGGLLGMLLVGGSAPCQKISLKQTLLVEATLLRKSSARPLSGNGRGNVRTHPAFVFSPVVRISCSFVVGSVFPRFPRIFCGFPRIIYRIYP